MTVLVRSALAGLGFGVCWGIAARVWMRLISTAPEFSWAGTGMIIGLTGIAGLTLGILAGVRRVGGSRWWRILAVLCLPTFASPGLLFLPAFLLGGLLVRRSLWARLAGASGIVLAEVALWASTGGEPVDNPWIFYGGFLVLCLPVAAGAAELYRPSQRSRAAVVSAHSA